MTAESTEWIASFQTEHRRRRLNNRMSYVSKCSRVVTPKRGWTSADSSVASLMVTYVKPPVDYGTKIFVVFFFWCGFITCNKFTSHLDVERGL